MAAVAVPRRHAAARLVPPEPRAGLLERGALVERLDALAHGRLTVVCAPTGYGKTTLLVHWAATVEEPLAWLPLTWKEREPDRFRALLDDAAARAGILVLDDFDAVAGSPAERVFARFLSVAPERLRVVLSTRRTPRLGLGLRRARGSLGELTDDDLRFGRVETARLLELVGGVRLDRPELDLLAWRTEGWPAGVRLAALAAAAAERPEEALAAFSGADPDVADYLRQEVLAAQPDDEHRDFLLRTSILEELAVPLCDALLRRDDSHALLCELAGAGAFLVPLDDDGTVFRYRRMAREFLRAELESACDVTPLHRRASVACERAGRVDEAAMHARAAGDEHRAATVARRHALDQVRAGRVEAFGLVLGDGPLGRKRPALEPELRRLAAAGDDVPELLAAAGRVAALCAGLPGGPVVELARATAAAARAYALLLANRVDEALAAARAEAPSEPSAAGAQLAAVGSLAAAFLGLPAVAAPGARAGAAAARAAGVRSGTAAALARAAEAVVLAEEGEPVRAERLLEAAAREPAVRSLALALLARTRARRDAPGARAALARADVRAALPTAIAAAAEVRLADAGRHPPRTRELSPAELRVLRLLPGSLSQREIARELYLSPNTVKTHARVIYRKLDVVSRDAAVRAARELNLV